MLKVAPGSADGARTEPKRLRMTCYGHERLHSCRKVNAAYSAGRTCSPFGGGLSGLSI